MFRILLISFILFSCNQTHWKQRGLKKGWIDTTKVSETFTIKQDTLFVDSLVNVYVDKLDSIFLHDTIHSHKDQIKYIIKNKLLVEYKFRAFKDTSFITKNGEYSVKIVNGDIEINAKYTKTEIKEPGYMDKHRGTINLILVLLCLFFGYLIIRRVFK